jgi:tryptophan 2,3-dioxygenase
MEYSVTKPKGTVNYSDYLKLNELLSSQKLISEEFGRPAHDETLFIIIHQTYELWFKQVLHELDDVLRMFREDIVDEKNIGIAVLRCNRIIEIQKLLIDQVRILETMTPLDFLEFRNLLTPASGFQSLQFRKIEIKLGLQPDRRIRYGNQEYYNSYVDDDRNQLCQLEKELSLFDAVEKWLERTPFIEFGDYNFLDQYQEAVWKIVKEEEDKVRLDPNLSEESRAMRIKMIKDNGQHFKSIFDEKEHQEKIRNHERRLSHKAMLAALFIHLYRHQPILHLPYKFLAGLLDIDELFTTWRYRHSLMVLRMIGKRIGTGGSSGYEYLRTTADKHKIFSDLFDLSTFLISRSQLPPLPENVIQALSFYYTHESNKTK